MTTRSRRSSKNSTKREQGVRGACEEPAASGWRATKYRYISQTPARAEAVKGEELEPQEPEPQHRERLDQQPGAKGQQDRNQTLREEDGRSRRSPRQQRKVRRTRLRSGATRAKSGDGGRRGKARGTRRGALRSRAKQRES